MGQNSSYPCWTFVKIKVWERDERIKEIRPIDLIITERKNICLCFLMHKPHLRVYLRCSRKERFSFFIDVCVCFRASISRVSMCVCVSQRRAALYKSPLIPLFLPG